MKETGYEINDPAAEPKKSRWLEAETRYAGRIAAVVTVVIGVLFLFWAMYASLVRWGPILRDALTTVSSVALVVAGVVGLLSWKKQAKWREKHEIAQRVLLAASAARNAARSCLKPADDDMAEMMLSALEELKQELPIVQCLPREQILTQVRSARMHSLFDAANKLIIEVPVVRLSLGQSTAEAVETLGALAMEYILPDEGADEGTAKSLDSAFDTLENLLRPYI